MSQATPCFQFLQQMLNNALFSAWCGYNIGLACQGKYLSFFKKNIIICLYSESDTAVHTLTQQQQALFCILTVLVVQHNYKLC